MRYHIFIDRVTERVHLPGRDEAIRTARAVLETLGERLYKTERSKLAAELPKELKGFLGEKAAFKLTRENQDRFTMQEFHNRVGERAGTGHREAVRRTEGVFAVLGEAVSEGVLSESLRSLPEEFSRKLSPR